MTPPSSDFPTLNPLIVMRLADQPSEKTVARTPACSSERQAVRMPVRPPFLVLDFSSRCLYAIKGRAEENLFRKTSQ